MPSWVSEGSSRKYVRAVETLRKENVDRKARGEKEVEITEEMVKALYIKHGGLVLGDASTVKGVMAGDEEAAEARSSAADDAKPAVVAKRVKKVKKAKAEEAAAE